MNEGYKHLRLEIILMIITNQKDTHKGCLFGLSHWPNSDALVSFAH
jgi:hypothetical protein